MLIFYIYYCQVRVHQIEDKIKIYNLELKIIYTE